MTTRVRPLINQQRGFSLIEALVAFLILSVGMLGIASLQTVSLKAGYTAALRSMAVQENQEILERMRANMTSVRNGTASKYNGTVNASLSVPSPKCSDSTGTVVSCTPAQLASYDVYEWTQDLVSNFPTGVSATITVGNPATVNLPNPVTVSITWTERDPGATNNTLNMTYSTTQLL